MNKFISIILCTLLLFLLSFSVFAITPYSSVTEDTSQIKILIEYMLNTPGYDFIESDWIALRSDQYRYDLYFNFDYEENVCNRISYIGTQQQMGQVNWIISYTEDVQTPDITFNGYTMVGNLPETLYSKLDHDNRYQSLILPLFFFCGIVFIYSVFRVKKRGL